MARKKIELMMAHAEVAKQEQEKVSVEQEEFAFELNKLLIQSVQELTKKVSDLEGQVERLTSRLTLIEAQRSVPQPYKQDPFQWPNPWNIPQWESKSSCQKCGLKLESAMGYVCNNYPCPTGLGGAWSGEVK